MTLVRALALQVQFRVLDGLADLRHGNARQDVEEMAVLCRELLSSASGPSEPNVVNSITRFAEAVSATLIASWDRPSNQVIECLCEANMRLPHVYAASSALCQVFAIRFFATKLNGDYEKAMSIIDKVLIPHSPAENPNPHLGKVFDLAARLAEHRFHFYGYPEYLEDAIFRTNAYLGWTSVKDPNRSAIIHSLSKLEKERFDILGVINGLPNTHSVGSEVSNLQIPPFSHLATSLAARNATSSPMTATDYMRHFRVIASLGHITDTSVIEEAARYCQLLLASLQDRPNDVLTVAIMDTLGKFFYHAFNITKKPEYLDGSIDVHKRILNMPCAQWAHLEVPEQLVISLMSRFRLSGTREDVDELMRLFPITVNDQPTNTPDRFRLSVQWSQLARASGHPSVSTAYQSAISLLQDSLVFVPTLQTQHYSLVAMRSYIEKLPSAYASYQVNVGQLKKAVEILERGRGLLWSEIRGLRTSTDRLRTASSHLAEKFTDLNRELETLTMSGSPSIRMNNGGVGGGEETASIGQIAVKQRKLLDERNSLLTQIRSFPGFENFLMPPSFDTLRSAAMRGPVVIINHCGWRSDIIILLNDSPPSLISTTDNFYARVRDLKDYLLEARKLGLDSTEYEDALTSVLKTLYDLIGRPLIQRLNELNVPEQSRIWWCPTSVLCSLPLHAMGPIRSDGRHELYFSDLYITSYTPTLSALIDSREPGLRSLEKPSILLVAQPDESMPQAWNETRLIRGLDTKVTTLISKRATPSVVMERLKDHRFTHFTCHGILEAGKPFDASFKLHQDQRLTLLEIIRSQLPSAEFAFLSACHTAELTEESIADEGLHLSAAVQYSGFRSVVGTMWAMADVDGQVLAKHFYASVFSERWEGVSYYERTAEALRDAVQELRRRKRVTTERWVNFVHYGA
jgi:CHAT domain-containing protein